METEQGRGRRAGARPDRASGATVLTAALIALCVTAAIVGAPFPIVLALIVGLFDLTRRWDRSSPR